MKSWYELNSEVTMYYTNSPIPTDIQYMVGEEVSIFDMDTKQTIATFIVVDTDPYVVKGIINWVEETKDD